MKFKDFLDTLIAQIMRRINKKADKTEVQQGLNKKVNILEVNDITALTNEQCEALITGDEVLKVDSTGKHAYKVSFKKAGVGLCLTYNDTEYTETISYDYVNDNWVYNSKDSLAFSTKVDKVNGVVNDIVLFDANGAIKDSGKSIDEVGRVATISIGGGTPIEPDTNKNIDLPAYPTKTSLDLNNVDNTSDLNKPISTATQAALNKKVNIITVDNIQNLSTAQCDSLVVGDIVAKVTGTQKHSYRVSYKEENTGLCLTYTDASVSETVSYDYISDEWVYNSTDITPLETTTNKVTAINAQSTDQQYPSAKLLYDQLALKQGNMTAITNAEIDELFDTQQNS